MCFLGSSVGRDEKSRPFYDAYQKDIQMDDNEDFLHLGGEEVNADEDDENENERTLVMTAAEVHAQLREEARRKKEEGKVSILSSAKLALGLYIGNRTTASLTLTMSIGLTGTRPVTTNSTSQKSMTASRSRLHGGPMTTTVLSLTTWCVTSHLASASSRACFG